MKNEYSTTAHADKINKLFDKLLNKQSQKAQYTPKKKAPRVVKARVKSPAQP